MSERKPPQLPPKPHSPSQHTAAPMIAPVPHSLRKSPLVLVTLKSDGQNEATKSDDPSLPENSQDIDKDGYIQVRRQVSCCDIDHYAQFGQAHVRSSGRGLGKKASSWSTGSPSLMVAIEEENEYVPAFNWNYIDGSDSDEDEKMRPKDKLRSFSMGQSAFGQQENETLSIKKSESTRCTERQRFSLPINPEERPPMPPPRTKKKGRKITV